MRHAGGQPGRFPATAPAALLGAVLSLGGCACCGPRYFGDAERAVGYQPMGQQRPSAEYQRELWRTLAKPGGAAERRRLVEPPSLAAG